MTLQGSRHSLNQELQIGIATSLEFAFNFLHWADQQPGGGIRQENKGALRLLPRYVLPLSERLHGVQGTG